MNLKIINRIRTNNFKDEAIMKKITELWKEASTALKNHAGVTYGLYYDYESDYKGDYTLSVAVESDGNDANTIRLPDTDHYEVFEVDPSDEHGILNTWKQIWEREEKGDLTRAYTSDFEKYHPNGQIQIYIAIK